MCGIRRARPAATARTREPSAGVNAAGYNTPSTRIFPSSCGAGIGFLLKERRFGTAGDGGRGLQNCPLVSSVLVRFCCEKVAAARTNRRWVAVMAKTGTECDRQPLQLLKLERLLLVLMRAGAQFGERTPVPAEPY
jgi:hypothetical protein